MELLPDRDHLQADALHAQGIGAFQAGHVLQALDLLTRAQALSPSNPHVRVNLGICLAAQHQHREALQHFQQALEIDPTLLMAHYQMAQALHALGHPAQALAHLRTVLEHRPQDALALNLQGLLLLDTDPTQAVEAFKQAIIGSPKEALFHFNLATAYRRLGQHALALAAFDEALRHDPNSIATWCNKGNALRDMGALSLAQACYEQAQQRSPSHPDVLWNLSLLLLQQGAYARGWPLYAYRLQKTDALVTPFDGPALRHLDDANQRTIGVWAEQGLGDVIQFCRYVPLLADQGARVILRAPSTLHPLLRTLPGVSQLISETAPVPPFDFQCPLMSLPELFQTQLDTIPSHDHAYLSVAPSAIERWRVRLGPPTRPRIGLTVRGHAHNPRDASRSIGLDALLPYLPSIFEYVLLHDQLAPSDEAALKTAPQVRRVDHEIHDFEDTAALCMLMSLVISVDTSVAHLSAALGQPTWILLAANSDWRWLTERTDSPWYDSVRLYRAGLGETWSPILHQLSHDLLNYQVE